MKIDLHCHTKNTKNKESDLRNVSVEKFKEKVELSEVKFLAITNHNCFFKDNYKELKEAVKDLCYVIPGIELDVEGINKSRGHVILIANPDDVDDFEDDFEDDFDDDFEDEEDDFVKEDEAAPAKDEE